MIIMHKDKEEVIFMKKYSIFKHLLMVIITLVLYYFLLPAINPRSPGFYSFLLLLAIIYLALSIPEMIKQGINNLKMKEAIKKLPTPIRIVMIIGVVNILVMIIGSLSGAKIFNAAKYANLIEMKSGDFVEDVAEINMSQIPLGIQPQPWVQESSVKCLILYPNLK